jgi:predicted RNA binding protein YcfA (HicA-like mRNA interferase family)
MNSNELMRKLSRIGASVDPSKGKGSHAFVVLKGRGTTVPMHARQEIAKGTLHKILKDLGLKLSDL